MFHSFTKFISLIIPDVQHFSLHDITKFKCDVIDWQFLNQREMQISWRECVQNSLSI